MRPYTTVPPFLRSGNIHSFLKPAALCTASLLLFSCWLFDSPTDTPPGIPEAPTSLSLSNVTSSRIGLAWSDNSGRETGFRIERAPDNGSGGAGTFAEVATVGANATAYTNAGLSQQTPYFYRVRAYNTAGNSGYTNVESATTATAASGQIIADHTVVDRYADIPQQYIDIVKTWLVDAAGESHSEAYRTGVDAMEALDSRFQAQTFTSGFPAKTSTTLRLGSHDSVGEEDFWTNPAAVANIKSRISAQNSAGNPINVIFQAWCWDFVRMTGPAGTGTNAIDSVYGCHWYGSSVGGPQGDHIWGLDAGDFGITGNSLSTQSYLDVVDDYRQYCAANGYVCVPVFSTGPVDGESEDGEQGYQRYLKDEYIRSHVRLNSDRVLFDYADILCYNDAGARNTLTWTDTNGVTHTFAGIHPDNMGGTGTGHIGRVGALRLGKAMWWMLARMAGWDGQP